MAMETRKNGKQYYYRYSRKDGSVIREYIGSGSKAQIAVEADRKVREERAATRAAERREINEVNKALEPLGEFTRAFESLLESALSASGLDRRRGEWRKT